MKISFSYNIGFFQLRAVPEPAVPEPVEGSKGGCKAKPHPLDLSSLIVHVLGVACIYNRDGIALYRIGKIPLVSVGHVISFPTFKRWFTS